MAQASTSSMANVRNQSPDLFYSKISVSLTRSTSPLLSGPPTRISAGAIRISSPELEGLEESLAMACGIPRGTTIHPDPCLRAGDLGLQLKPRWFPPRQAP